MLLKEVPKADACKFPNVRAIVYYHIKTFRCFFLSDMIKKISILLIALVDMNPTG